MSGLLPYCSRERYLTSVNALSGWYSLVGVLTEERIMQMLNSENPRTMVVRHNRAVFMKTLSFLRVRNRPQKHSARRASTKNAAPLLYGSPKTFTNRRST